MLASGGELLHTHEPEPMRALLAALDEPPDLVVADHGWAGAAAEASSGSGSVRAGAPVPGGAAS